MGNRNIVEEKIKIFRDEWELKNEPILKLDSLAKAKGFLLLSFPNNHGISGIHFRKKDREKPHECIYINSNEPRGRYFFTLAHELYHVYFEPSKNLICYTNKCRDEIEIRADIFASLLLIPRDYLYNILREKNINKNTQLSLNVLFDIQKKFNVSFQALLYSLSEMKKNSIYENQIPDLRRYMKYYNKKYWNLLSDKTRKYDKNNLLNTVIPEYSFPEKFKYNLLNNYVKGRIEKNEIIEIFTFFNEEVPEQ